MSPALRDCPCHSKRRFSACCGPILRGERLAASPEELMRSRYSAFAIGQGTHLIATLADEHADRKGDTAAIARELSRAKERQRFLDLAIKHASQDGDHGEVLFYARIFERGQDRSFVELSTFVKQHGEWRYASGKLVPASGIPGDPRALTKEQLLLLVT